MGTPTPPPPVYGDTCGFCTPLLWGSGQTPKFVMCEFKDITKCDASPIEPPNEMFMLEQLEAAPCEWRYEDDDYYISWHLMETGTVLMALWPGGIGKIFFMDSPAVPCELNFANDYAGCNTADEFGSGGTAEITWV